MIAIASTTRKWVTCTYAVITLLFSLFSMPGVSQTVTPWMTTGDQTKLIQQQPAVSFGANSGTNPSTITLNAATTYQAIDALGFCLTEGSAEVISGLAATQQNALLNELFSAGGIGNSAIRISIGASDLSSSVYSYNETAGDVNMNNFSLAGPDLTYLVPIIKKALLINPNLKILATPWTAPRWMKTNNDRVGGSLNTAYYAAYANYFVKYFQAMQAQGISIWGITPQNEPGNPFNNPSMSMSSTEQKNFINNNLGPAMAAAGFGNIKIIAYDHNCDNTAFPIDVANNSSYVDGSAFHLYAGDISAMTTVKNATNKNVYFTEQYTGSGGSFSGDFGFHMKNVVMGSINNWSKAVFEWNIASNAALEPHTPGGCTSCLGAYTINSSTSYTRNVSYYIIGQISKFVKAGAVRIGSSTTDGNLYQSAFKNPDGSLVALVYNNGTAATAMKLVSGSSAFNYTIPAASAVTFTWTTGPPVAVTGVSISPASASVAVNNTTQLTATVAPANATNQNVSWASNNASVATVSATGLVTGLTAGTAIITVTTQDGNRTASSTITVNVIAVTGVSVSPAAASIFATQTQQLTATVTPANASNKNVSWTSGNNSIATVSSTGLVTGISPGTATITARTVSGNYTATAAITVNDQQPYSGTPITLPGVVQAENYDKGGQNLAYNDTDAANNGGQYRTSEGVDIANISGTAGYTVGWTENGEWMEYTVNVTAGTYSVLATVATPNAGRQMTIKLDGTTLTTINVPNTGDYGTFQTVTVPNIVFAGGNNKVLRFEIIGGSFNIDAVEVKAVTTIPVTGVTVSPASVSVEAGSAVQLTATVNPSNATNKNVTWTSSNAAVATVNATGLVTAVAAGTATITVTTNDGSKTATCAVTVTASPSSFPGYYNILARHSGKGLDVADNATNSGARLQQYDVTNGGGSNQRWSFIPAGNGNYYIKVKSTQMCMAPSSTGTADGEKVQQRTCGTANEFKWTVTPTGGGFYKITNVNSGKALDVQDVSTSNGANIQVWAYGGGNNQQWQFIQVEATNRSSGNKPALIENTFYEQEVSIYPNPATDYITLLLNNSLVSRVEICSINGGIILKKQFVNNTKLDVSKLTAGIYTVKIVNEASTVYRKIAIQ